MASRYRILIVCAAVVLSVSTFDTYLVCLFRETILMDERNPICVALIERDPNRLTWFIGGKLIGNLFVISVLTLLFRFRYEHCRIVALAVAGFQILLTAYLFLSDSLTGLLHFDGLYSNDPLCFRKSLDSLILHGFVTCVIGFGLTVMYLGFQVAREPEGEDSLVSRKWITGIR